MRGDRDVSQDVTLGGLLMLEYERVKGEQQARIGFRDNLLYASLAAMAAVITAVLQSDGRTELLLLLPPVSALLGWTYLVNDEKVSAIGRYIREELSPRLATLAQDREQGSETEGGHRHGGERGQAGDRIQVFGWETVHRTDRRRWSRKRLQLAVDLTTFCGAPLAALLVFWSAGPRGVPLIALSWVELAAIAVLAGQIVVYADLGRRRPAMTSR